MSFIDFFSQVNATLAGPSINICNDVTGQRVQALIGPEHISEHFSPPRIVVVPCRRLDKFTAKRIARTNAAGPNLPAIGTRTSMFEIHCWGSDWAAAQELDRCMRAAMQLVGPGIVQAMGGGWNYDTLVTNDGRDYVALTGIDFPITAGPWTATPENPRSRYESVSGVVPGTHETGSRVYGVFFDGNGGTREEDSS